MSVFLLKYLIKKVLKMNIKENILYLASSSSSRQKLLDESQIPFIAIGHNADEDSVDKKLPFKKLILEIARLKMEHAQLPKGQKEGEEIFVLSADSMGYDEKGIVHGKSKNRADAVEKIRTLSGKLLTSATAFCLDKKRWSDNKWKLIARKESVVESQCKFKVIEKWIDRYLKYSWAMKSAGAISIELYGAQFLEWLNGSYSAVMGLPLYELREALDELNFFKG